MCVRARVCVLACVRMRARACVCVCLVQAAPPCVEQWLAVVPQLLEGELAHAAEDAVGPAARPHRVQDVLREAEGHALWRLEVEAVVEEAAEVDVHHRAGRRVDEDVLEVAVAKPHRHPDHGHDAVGASEGEPRVEPGRGRAEGVDQPQVHHGRQLEHERVHERDERGDAPLLGLRHGGGVARLDRARREGDLVHVVVLLAQVAHGHHVGHPLDQAALLAGICMVDAWHMYGVCMVYAW